ncbi:MAG: preprotein translocase subunit SecG [Candidatus Spechtbacterales bacterium]
MNTETIFLIAIIAVVIPLIVVILLQQRGSSLGGAFGGSGDTYYQKRGMEKVLFYTTIALAITFLGLAIANLLLAS